MRFWIDSVLVEFARMTWEEWIATLFGAFGLALILAWCTRKAPLLQSPNHGVMDAGMQDHYKQRAETVWRWHEHGRQFICAANRLVPSFEASLNPPAGPIPEEHAHTSFEPIMMLFGVAAENILKALLIAKGTPPVSDGKLNKTLKSHDLASLAGKAGITLTPLERQLLKRLQDFIESGKYPIGINATSGQGARHFTHDSDFEDTWALLQKLDDAVYAARQPSLGQVNVRNLGKGKLG